MDKIITIIFFALISTNCFADEINKTLSWKHVWMLSCGWDLISQMNLMQAPREAKGR